MPRLGEAEDMPQAPLRRFLGHEQLTAFVLMLREVRYKEKQTPFYWPHYPK